MLSNVWEVGKCSAGAKGTYVRGTAPWHEGKSANTSTGVRFILLQYAYLKSPNPNPNQNKIRTWNDAEIQMHFITINLNESIKLTSVTQNQNTRNAASKCPGVSVCNACVWAAVYQRGQHEFLSSSGLARILEIKYQVVLYVFGTKSIQKRQSTLFLFRSFRFLQPNKLTNKTNRPIHDKQGTDMPAVTYKLS